MFLSNALDTPVPTVFEMSMAESLRNGMKPAFDYLVTILSAQNRLVFETAQFKDEIFALLSLVIERHYISTIGGSFTESFYGLKRMQVGDGEPGSTDRFRPLTSRDKLVTLMSLAFGPYLNSKLRQVHHAAVQKEAQQIRESGSNSSTSVSNPQPEPRLFRILRKIYVKLFPIGMAVHGSASFLMQLLFIFGKSDHYSPSLWLLGQAVVRQTRDDIAEQTRRAAALQAVHSNSSILSRIWQHFLSALRWSLVGSAVIFKLVEWYYSPANQSDRERAFAESTHVPPPPRPSQVLPRSKRLVQNPHLCPLCGETRKNPALSSGGAVFCYTCIQQHVQEHGECPVTGVPCKALCLPRNIVHCKGPEQNHAGLCNSKGPCSERSVRLDSVLGEDACIGKCIVCRMQFHVDVYCSPLQPPSVARITLRCSLSYPPVRPAFRHFNREQY